MVRIGVDFGGTKIEAAALDAGGRVLARVRASSPRSYEAGLLTVRALVAETERQAGVSGASVGVGGPGPGPECSCGRRNCLELWISGPGLAQDHGGRLTAEGVAAAARSGQAGAKAAFDRYVDRLARGLAVVCGVLDPDVIVLGGGMSNVDELYGRLPGAIAPLVFSDIFTTPVARAEHGDSSGVRGAAWLWPLSP